MDGRVGDRVEFEDDPAVEGPEAQAVAVTLEEFQEAVGDGLVAGQARPLAVGDRRDQQRAVVELAAADGDELDRDPGRLARPETGGGHPGQGHGGVVGRPGGQGEGQGVDDAVGAMLAGEIAVRTLDPGGLGRRTPRCACPRTARRGRRPGPPRGSSRSRSRRSGSRRRRRSWPRRRAPPVGRARRRRRSGRVPWGGSGGRFRRWRGSRTRSIVLHREGPGRRRAGDQAVEQGQRIALGHVGGVLERGERPLEGQFVVDPAVLPQLVLGQGDVVVVALVAAQGVDVAVGVEVVELEACRRRRGPGAPRRGGRIALRSGRRRGAWSGRGRAHAGRRPAGSRGTPWCSGCPRGGSPGSARTAPATARGPRSRAGATRPASGSPRAGRSGRGRRRGRTAPPRRRRCRRLGGSASRSRPGRSGARTRNPRSRG